MLRKPIVIETRFVPPWTGAIMLWPFILYRPGRRGAGLATYMHHLWHQCRRCWVLPWFLCYLILGLFHLPRKRWWQHPLQVSAHLVSAGLGEPSRLLGKEGRTVAVPYRVRVGCARASGPPAHPGELIGRMFLDGLGFTEEEFSGRLGVSPEFLRAVLQGDEAVTADFALRLERVTRVGADFWLALQNRRDQWQVTQSESAAAIEALEPLPLAT